MIPISRPIAGTVGIITVGLIYWVIIGKSHWESSFDTSFGLWLGWFLWRKG